MIVTLEHLAHVESLIFVHLRLHDVLHDARVEVLAGLFGGQVVLLGVVEQGLAAVILIKW